MIELTNAILFFLEGPLGRSVIFTAASDDYWPNVPLFHLVTTTQTHTQAVSYLQFNLHSRKREILFGNGKFWFSCYLLFSPFRTDFGQFPVSCYNSQLCWYSYFQVESHFMIFCHISSFSVPWCVISPLVTILKRLPTSQIYHTSPHPHHSTNKDINLVPLQYHWDVPGYLFLSRDGHFSLTLDVLFWLASGSCDRDSIRINLQGKLLCCNILAVILKVGSIRSTEFFPSHWFW